MIIHFCTPETSMVISLLKNPMRCLTQAWWLQMVTQAHEGQATGTDDNVQSSWTVILLIYITGFLVAFSGNTL